MALLKKECTQRVNKAEYHEPIYTDFSWHLEQVEKVYRFRQIPVPEGKISWSGYKKRRRIDKVLNAAHGLARQKRLEIK